MGCIFFSWDYEIKSVPSVLYCKGGDNLTFYIFCCLKKIPFIFSSIQVLTYSIWSNRRKLSGYVIFCYRPTSRRIGGVNHKIFAAQISPIYLATYMYTQSNELTRGPPELVQHFRL